MRSRRCTHLICIDRARRLVGSERGNAMPEYAWLIALISILIVAGLSYFGPAVANPLTNAAVAFDSGASSVDDSDDDDADDDDSDDDDADDDDSDDDDSDDDDSDDDDSDDDDSDDDDSDDDDSDDDDSDDDDTDD